MIFFTEAIKLENRILQNLEYHHDRANRTASKFYGTEIDLFAIQDSLPTGVGLGLYKCRVVYGTKIEKIEYIPYVLTEKKRVGFVVDNGVDYSYKYEDRSRLTNLIRSSGCDDVIIIKNGMVTDASASNLVFESASGEELVTPADCLLGGTKRQYLIDKGIVKEKPISIDEVRSYQKVYFISSMIDLKDNVQIDVQDLIV